MALKLLFVTVILIVSVYFNNVDCGDNRKNRLGDALRNNTSRNIFNNTGGDSGGSEDDDENILKREARKKLRDCGVDVSDEDGDNNNRHDRKNNRKRYKGRNKYNRYDGGNDDDENYGSRRNRYNRLSNNKFSQNRNPYKNFHLSDNDDEDDSDDHDNNNNRRNKNRYSDRDDDDENDDEDSSNGDDNDEPRRNRHRYNNNNNSNDRRHYGKYDSRRGNNEDCDDNRRRNDNPYFGGRNTGTWGNRDPYRGNGYDYGSFTSRNNYERFKRSSNRDDDTDRECLSQCVFGYLEVLDDSRVPSETMMVKWLQDNIANNDLKRIQALREARRCFARLTTSDMQDGCEFSSELSKCLQLELEK